AAGLRPRRSAVLTSNENGPGVTGAGAFGVGGLELRAVRARGAAANRPVPRAAEEGMEVESPVPAPLAGGLRGDVGVTLRGEAEARRDLRAVAQRQERVSDLGQGVDGGRGSVETRHRI